MLNLTVDQQLPVITTNFEMVKAELTESIKKYKGMVVTEDTLKSCKTDQGDLASARIKIDNYRKSVKKEISKPITVFEDNCKVLISLVEDAEKPLKAGIAVFDQKKKDSNRKIAEDIILAAIKEHGLIEKYSVGLTVLDKYTNLTAKPKDVKNDVEQRLFLLLQEQEQEIETLQIMKDTIVNVNKNIDAKLSLQDFQSLIDMNASPVKVMAEINARAERIRLSEEKAIADKAARAEKIVQERIAKAEREAAEKTRIEERNIRIAKEAAEDTEKLRLIAIVQTEENAERLKLKATEKLEQEAKLREVARNVHIGTKPIREVEFDKQIAEKATVPDKEANPNEKIYFIEMRAEGTIGEITALGGFLKDNGYTYTVTDKGVLI